MFLVMYLYRFFSWMDVVLNPQPTIISRSQFSNHRGVTPSLRPSCLMSRPSLF